MTPSKPNKAELVSRDYMAALQTQRELDQSLMKVRKAIEFTTKSQQKNLRLLKHHQDAYDQIVGSTSWKFIRPAKALLGPIARKVIGNRRAVEACRIRLLNLGFSDKAYAELQTLSKSRFRQQRNRALWELALWHANKYTAEDARQCLDYLAKLSGKEAASVRTSIIRAECGALLGMPDRYRGELERVLRRREPDANGLLALANLETFPQKRLRLINGALKLSHIQEVALKENSAGTLYDRLTPPKKPKPISSSVKVTVIIPAYNSADTIHTALDSLQNQTWQNLEIIVADDCSTDATVKKVEAYRKKDPRILVVKTPVNSGPYVARNVALQRATGELVTTHDADDWSHEQKIEIQARHLVENSSAMANTSQQARANSDLIFHRRGNPGYYIQSNMSSLMFRREPVMEKLGYWDSVRFGADSEFIRRLRIVFGKDAVAELPHALLSFQRKSDESLTGSEAFGYHGFFMGARKEYMEAQERFHISTPSYYYPFPQETRPFPVPDIMLPLRAAGKGERRHVDTVFVADFRREDLAEKFIDIVKSKAESGASVGVVQAYEYGLNPWQRISSRLRNLLDEGLAQMIVFGERIDCERLIILDPSALSESQRYIPDIKSEETLVITANSSERSMSQITDHFGQFKTIGYEAWLKAEEKPGA